MQLYFKKNVLQSCSKFEHFLHAKCFILLSIIFMKKYIYFTFLYLLTLILLLYSDCSKCVRFYRQLHVSKRIYFFNASHSIFLKKDYNTNNIKTKFFCKNRRQAFAKNAMILTCAKIQGKLLMFSEVGTLESSFWDWNVREYSTCAFCEY